MDLQNPAENMKRIEDLIFSKNQMNDMLTIQQQQLNNIDLFPQRTSNIDIGDLQNHENTQINNGSKICFLC